MVDSQQHVKDFEPENTPAHIFLLDVFIWMLYIQEDGVHHSTGDSTNSEEQALQKAQHMGDETSKRLKEEKETKTSQ